MTPAELNYLKCGLRLRVVTAQLLLQISGPDRDVAARLADLLDFAQTLGSTTQADSISAFRAAQKQELENAQKELDLLQRAEIGYTLISPDRFKSRDGLPDATFPRQNRD